MRIGHIENNELDESGNLIMCHDEDAVFNNSVHSFAGGDIESQQQLLMQQILVYVQFRRDIKSGMMLPLRRHQYIAIH